MIDHAHRVRDRGLGSAQGFTLLELLLVISIMGTLTWIGTGTFVKMTTHWREIKAISDLEIMSNTAIASIRADFSHLESSELSGRSLKGIRNEIAGEDVDSERFNDRVLADDRVTFSVQSKPIASDRLVTETVSYYILRDGKRHRLVRSVFDATTNEHRQEFSLIDGAQAVRLRFEYASDDGAEGWLDRWDRQTLPRAVRVSLMIEDPERPDRQIARKAVFGNEVR